METTESVPMKIIGSNEYIKYTITFSNEVSDLRIDFDINGTKKTINNTHFSKKIFTGVLKVSDIENYPLSVKFACKTKNDVHQTIAHVKIEYRRKMVFNQSIIKNHSNQILTFEVNNIRLNKRSFTVRGGLKKFTAFKRRNYAFKLTNKNELIKDLQQKSESAENNKGEQIQIYFATNRNKTGKKDINSYFGDKLDKLTYGFCKINIPKNHIQGNIERPSKILWLFSLWENDEKHISLKKIEEKSEDDFYEWLKKDLPNTENKSALLFVHGYNTSFAEAARRTGQIAYDTPFNGLTGFFSWPSSGATLNYFSDIENADASIPKLEKFIEDFIIRTEVKKIHIIAHSMGNRLVTSALNNLFNKQSFKPYLGVIDQIVLAAPDLDQDVFTSTILPTFQNIGAKRTLYASDKDVALNFSKNFRRGKIRLGQGGENVFVSQGIDSVDASNVMSKGNHHSYIFETKELLMDMNILFEDGWEPKKRRLIDKPKNGLLYWLFRE